MVLWSAPPPLEVSIHVTPPPEGNFSGRSAELLAQELGHKKAPVSITGTIFQDYFRAYRGVSPRSPRPCYATLLSECVYYYHLAGPVKKHSRNHSANETGSPFSNFCLQASNAAGYYRTQGACCSFARFCFPILLPQRARAIAAGRVAWRVETPR